MTNDADKPQPLANPVYIARAQYCIRAAHAASTVQEKESWLDVAEQWLRLALPARSREQKDFQDALVAKHTGQKDSDSVN
ncbi:MAG: hypothetical protein AB7E79_13340 [Rhodospirillaceae bacterium]